MKTYLMPAIKLTLVFIVICSVCYPLLIAGAGKFTKGGGDGEKVSVNGKVVGYANLGQKFTDDKYFQGRPSAVDYNAAGSAGSNKGPNNPEYLQLVRDRIDSFIVHNPGVSKAQIPAEMVTASGSGLDPNISPASAYIQVKRVATARNLPEARLMKLIEIHTEKHILGPDIVNVLELNVAVDKLK